MWSFEKETKWTHKRCNYAQNNNYIEKSYIKAMRTLVEHHIERYTFYLINYRKSISAFTVPEDERKNMKYWQSSKNNWYFLKTNIFKIITDIR